MPDEKLEPDDDALEAWEHMPKGDPSKEAMTPMTKGFPGWLIGLVALAVIIIILSLLQT